MKWSKNGKILRKLEAIGIFLTLLGLIVKFSITDVQVSDFSKTVRNFESYHTQYVTHDLELITGIVSPGYISTKESFIALSNYLMAGVSYYMDGLDISKAEKDDEIQKLQRKGKNICDNNTYKAFKYQCDSVISIYANKVYEQYDKQTRLISMSNNWFKILTVLGSLMILISKWCLSKQ